MNFVPYWPVRLVYTIPASKPVQNTPLFRTRKNTGHTNEIWLYQPVNGYRAEMWQAFFFLLLILTFFKGKLVIFLNPYSNPNTTHKALSLSISLKLSLSCFVSLTFSATLSLGCSVSHSQVKFCFNFFCVELYFMLNVINNKLITVFMNHDLIAKLIIVLIYIVVSFLIFG